ncbi:hypothetical protein DFP72DRAFT_913629 [Ephemerocybe angulata]|uniref:Uncharacterized protein n=1 Tax=Ephemerocybe angulata TaxID=980116 RepID=A0A8H6HM85_9AGAR|nr:hypothetical protein DFP72DRAFT_913629 [Tulosesus angulatus]
MRFPSFFEQRKSTMLYKTAALALLAILAASVKPITAAPVQDKKVYQFVECTFTVQEIGDAPYTFPNFPNIKIEEWVSTVTGLALASRSPGHSSLSRDTAIAIRDEADRSWTYKDAELGGGLSVEETQAVLESLPGTTYYTLDHDWLIREVKDCQITLRVAGPPARETVAE